VIVDIMDTEKRLIAETEKWLGKLEKLKIKACDKKGEEYLTNINAYISDSKHFLAKKDYVRAFEAVVWAWAWCEIGKDMEILNY